MFPGLENASNGVGRVTVFRQLDSEVPIELFLNLNWPRGFERMERLKRFERSEAVERLERLEPAVLFRSTIVQ